VPHQQVSGGMAIGWRDPRLRSAPKPDAASLPSTSVNAIGSVGGFLQEAVTHAVSDSYGWNALFVLFAVFSLAAALSLAPTFRRIQA
jgi:sugar phosphate permease